MRFVRVTSRIGKYDNFLPTSVSHLCGQRGRGGVPRHLMGSKTAVCGRGGVAGFFSKYSKIKVQEAFVRRLYVFFSRVCLGMYPVTPPTPPTPTKLAATSWDISLDVNAGQLKILSDQYHKPVDERKFTWMTA